MSPSLSRPAGHLRRLDEASVRELHAVSAILETLAVRRAAPYGAARRAELRAANARLRAATDPVTAAIADRDVHDRLVEPGADASLLATLHPVEAQLRRLAAVHGAGEPRRHAAEHDAIIDALAAGDHDLAAARLRAHLARRLPALLHAAAGEVAAEPEPA